MLKLLRGAVTAAAFATGLSAMLAIAVEKTAGAEEAEAWSWLMEHIRAYYAKAAGRERQS